MASFHTQNPTDIRRNLYCERRNSTYALHALHARQNPDSIVTLEIVTPEQVIHEFSAQGLQWNRCGLDRGSTLNTMLEDFTEVKFLTAVASAKSTSSDSKHKLCGSTLLPRRLAFDLFLLQLWPNYDIPVQYVLNAIGEPVLVSVKLGREWIRIVDINLQVINDFREMQQLIQSRCYNLWDSQLLHSQLLHDLSCRTSINIHKVKLLRMTNFGKAK